MGMVLGKIDVSEPTYKVLMTRNSSSIKIPYEIRSYGTRFAVEAEYTRGDQTRTPFQILAKYIGVFGDPHNEGKASIPMTAPVVMDTVKQESKGTVIDMTAPVVMGEKDSKQIMQFILPSSYNSLAEVPKPTNANVKVKELPPAVGAVYRYSGRYNDESNQLKAEELADQLIVDGCIKQTKDDMMGNFQFWGYNPPFTVPFLRRNEIWIPLSKIEVDCLLQHFPVASE